MAASSSSRGEVKVAVEVASLFFALLLVFAEERERGAVKPPPLSCAATEERVVGMLCDVVLAW